MEESEFATRGKIPLPLTPDGVRSVLRRFVCFRCNTRGDVLARVGGRFLTPEGAVPTVGSAGRPEHYRTEAGLMRKMLAAPQWLWPKDQGFLADLSKNGGNLTPRQAKAIRGVYERYQQNQQARFFRG